MNDTASTAEVVDLMSLEMRETVGEGTRYAGSYTGLCDGKARELGFSVSIIQPGCFSCPYHFHHAEEELFVLLDGAATLRTPDGFQKVKTGELMFFPTGSGGAHQLYNHTDKPCRILALSNKAKVEVGEFPDSGKISAREVGKLFRAADAVEYMHGEEDPASFWPAEIVARD